MGSQRHGEWHSKVSFAIFLCMKTILVDAVYAFVIEDKDTFKIFKEMQDLLDTFKNPKIILTGVDDEQFKKFGLDKMPYEVFTLKHNPEKTDPKYYKIMLKHFGLGKDDVVYFEHDPEAVESARLVGIISYHYDPDKKDLDSLKSFLDKNIDYPPFHKHNFPQPHEPFPQRPNFEKHSTWRTNNFSTPRQTY
jgi:FMN phosphatase YigB (HAD superfamily)